MLSAIAGGPPPDDPFALQRFVRAQDRGGTYGAALAELRAGRKTGHWIWFVFPQLAGLGRSETSRFYGISGVDEARAYLAHPVLGPRLVECALVVGGLADRTAVQVLGAVDATKLRSSMTLFELAAPGEPAFSAVLDRWYGAERDARTLAGLRGAGG